MMAILHGKKSGTSARGDRVPASVAAKYTNSKPGADTADSKGKEHEGGKWGEKHHSKAKEKTQAERTERKKNKAKLKKSLEEFIMSRDRKGAGCLLVDGEGRFLLGRRTDTGEWATPGGHVEESESHEEAALRELREETGLVGKNAQEIVHKNYRGYDCKSFLVSSYKGKLKPTVEMSNLKWFYVSDIPWDQMTDYAKDAILHTIKNKLSKYNNLEHMFVEELQKNIIRSGSAPHDTIYQVTHGDALKVIGNGTFRMLRDAVKDMGEEDFRDIKIDGHTLHIRKHTTDVYSGRVTDGHKQIHQFTNKSLPSVAVELMSIFEWYLPEDEGELQVMDDSELPDDAIEGGMTALMENYRKHNIVNIYHEMENIREEIRHGMAVDLQQVEAKIMKLFDKLESNMLDISDKHNDLTHEAGGAVDMLESKLRELQAKVDELSKQPVAVNAYSSAPQNDKQIHADYYPYLTRPSVSISPDGHIKIQFNPDWTHLDRENFLKDMKARAIKNSK